MRDNGIPVVMFVVGVATIMAGLMGFHAPAITTDTVVITGWLSACTGLLMGREK